MKVRTGTPSSPSLLSPKGALYLFRTGIDFLYLVAFPGSERCHRYSAGEGVKVFHLREKLGGYVRAVGVDQDPLSLTRPRSLGEDDCDDDAVRQWSIELSLSVDVSFNVTRGASLFASLRDTHFTD